MSDDNRDLWNAVNDMRVEVGKIQQWKESIGEDIKTFVTRTEFTVVKILVYGLAGTILSGVLTSLVSKILKP